MYESGLNFDMEPHAMTRPSGNAVTSVSANIIQVVFRPESRLSVTSAKLIFVVLYYQ